MILPDLSGSHKRDQMCPDVSDVTT